MEIDSNKWQHPVVSSISSVSPVRTSWRRTLSPIQNLFHYMDLRIKGLKKITMAV